MSQNVLELEKYGISSENLFSNIVLGNLIRFDVLNNNLIAIVGAQVSPVGGYIGDFYITYEFMDNKYQGNRINFSSVENVALK